MICFKCLLHHGLGNGTLTYENTAYNVDLIKLSVVPPLFLTLSLTQPKSNFGKILNLIWLNSSNCETFIRMVMQYGFTDTL